MIPPRRGVTTVDARVTLLRLRESVLPVTLAAPETPRATAAARLRVTGRHRCVDPARHTTHTVVAT